MTSVLQCLFHSIPIQKFFLCDVRHNSESCKCLRDIDRKSNYPADHYNPAAPCLTCEFDQMMLLYYSRCIGMDVGDIFASGMSFPNKDFLSIEPGTPLVISDFLVTAWKSDEMRHLAGHEQQDAHEFLQALIDVLDKECSRMERSIFAAKKQSMFSKFCTTQDQYSNDQEQSTVASYFKGTLKSILLCNECRCKRSQYEPFVNISLPINRYETHITDQITNQLSIPQCLDNFTESESLTDAVYCDYCRKNTTMMKQDTFAELPTILCLHLKRFDATNNKKIDIPISLPPCLHMGSYLPQWRELDQAPLISESETNALRPDTQPLYFYDLYATINHTGTLSQEGHYHANVKVNDKWYGCNDSHIRLLSSEYDVLHSNQAYIIFYMRRE